MRQLNFSIRRPDKISKVIRHLIKIEEKCYKLSTALAESSWDLMILEDMYLGTLTTQILYNQSITSVLDTL